MNRLTTVRDRLRILDNNQDIDRAHSRQDLLWVLWKRGVLQRYMRMLDVAFGVVVGGACTQLIKECSLRIKIWLLVAFIGLVSLLNIMSTVVDRRWANEEARTQKEVIDLCGNDDL